MDPRLSNTASMADYWMPTWPGSEVTVLLAMAKVILDEGGYDREFIRKWVNWETYLKRNGPTCRRRWMDLHFQRPAGALRRLTPSTGRESGVPAEQIVEIARQIARKRPARPSPSHNWRAASIGNLGGWMVARALYLLNVLTGSVGTEGGTSPKRLGQVRAGALEQARPRRSGATSSGRRSTRWRTTR
jgi:anaerobic selenocysteine-containing dehydrogenase